MKVEIPAALQRKAEAYADRHHPRGQVFLEMCSICGYIRFMSGIPAADRLVKVYVMNDSQLPGMIGCPRCREVAGRAPEIFEWVCNVIHLHYALKHPPAEESR